MMNLPSVAALACACETTCWFKLPSDATSSCTGVATSSVGGGMGVGKGVYMMVRRTARRDVDDAVSARKVAREPPLSEEGPTVAELPRSCIRDDRRGGWTIRENLPISVTE
jgi:hypothetical protein